MIRLADFESFLKKSKLLFFLNFPQHVVKVYKLFDEKADYGIWHLCYLLLWFLFFKRLFFETFKISSAAESNLRFKILELEKTELREQISIVPSSMNFWNIANSILQASNETWWFEKWSKTARRIINMKEFWKVTSEFLVFFAPILTFFLSRS